MKTSNCAREQLVASAVRSGQWDPCLRDHVASCSICQEVVQVSGWMQDLAAGLQPSSVPDARALWLKAQILQKRAAARKVMQPLEIFQKAAYGMATLVLVGLVFGNWKQVNNWVSRLNRSWLEVWSLAGMTPFSLPLFSLVAALIFVVSLVTLYNAFAEE